MELYLPRSGVRGKEGVQVGLEVVERSGSFVGQGKNNETLRFARPVFSSAGLCFRRNVRITAALRRNGPLVTRCNALFEGPRRVWIGCAVALAVGGLAIAAARIFQLRIMLTDSSAPAGIYRVVQAPALRGALAAACLPEAIARTGRARGYLSRGDCPAGAEPVAKVIGAVGGDVLELAPQAVMVNGAAFANSGTAARDSAGRPLVHAPWGEYRVAAGEVWLFGFHDARSWDARYFGPIAASDVRGVLRPLLTW